MTDTTDFDIDIDIDIDSIINAVSARTLVIEPRRKSPEWTQSEIEFLEKFAGTLDDDEIGAALGRTPNAIKVYRVRRRLKACSQAGKGWITANKAAKLLDIDAHKLTYWCRIGLLPGKFRVHADSGREYILVRYELLKRWCVNPANWVYIDWRRLKDTHIHRLCELRSERWGDEWWTTAKVAEHHGVDVSDVGRLIKRGEIKSFRPPYSLGGRNFKDTWRTHFVLKSEATRPDLVFYKKRGKPGISKKFSAGFDAFVLRARDELKLEWEVIARMMKVKQKSCQYRYWRLGKERRP